MYQSLNQRWILRHMPTWLLPVQGRDSLSTVTIASTMVQRYNQDLPREIVEHHTIARDPRNMECWTLDAASVQCELQSENLVALCCIAEAYATLRSSRNPNTRLSRNMSRHDLRDAGLGEWSFGSMMPKLHIAFLCFFDTIRTFWEAFGLGFRVAGIGFTNSPFCKTIVIIYPGCLQCAVKLLVWTCPVYVMCLEFGDISAMLPKSILGFLKDSKGKWCVVLWQSTTTLLPKFVV